MLSVSNANSITPGMVRIVWAAHADGVVCSAHMVFGLVEGARQVIHSEDSG
jgi:hypothetical protein